MLYPPTFKGGANQDNTLRVNTQSVTLLTLDNFSGTDYEYTPTANHNTLIIERDDVGMNITFRCHNLKAGDTITLIATSTSSGYPLNYNGDFLSNLSQQSCGGGIPIILQCYALGNGIVWGFPIINI